ncbi:MAG: radical SAM protein [Rhodospirillales bacterium]|nr:radical SAM protein [Rhodospirillales bacterium]
MKIFNIEPSANTMHATLIRENAPPPPIGATIEWAINNSCNLSCQHCYMEAASLTQGKRTSEKDLKWEIAQQIVRSAQVICISGGEPTLDKDLFDLIRYFRLMGIETWLGTNGTVPRKNLVAEIRNSRLNGVQVSLDSHNPDIHDKFRGVPGSWHKSIEFLKELKAEGIPFGINHTVHSENIKEFSDLYRLVDQLDAQFLYVLKFTPCGSGENNEQYCLSREDEKSFVLDTLVPLGHTSHIDIMTSMPSWNLLMGKSDENSVGCSHGHSIFISHKGELLSCPMVGDMYGNVLEDDQWLESFKEKTGPLRDRFNISGDCSECPASQHCGGCPAISQTKSPDPLSDGECWVYQDILRQFSPRSG